VWSYWADNIPNELATIGYTPTVTASVLRAHGSTGIPAYNTGTTLTLVNYISANEYLNGKIQECSYKFFTINSSVTTANVDSLSRSYHPASNTIDAGWNDYSGLSETTNPSVKKVYSTVSQNGVNNYYYQVVYKYTIPTAMSGKTISYQFRNIKDSTDNSALSFINYTNCFKVN